VDNSNRRTLRTQFKPSDGSLYRRGIHYRPGAKSVGTNQTPRLLRLLAADCLKALAGTPRFFKSQSAFLSGPNDRRNLFPELVENCQLLGKAQGRPCPSYVRWRSLGERDNSEDSITCMKVGQEIVP